MMTSKNQTQSWEYDVVGNRTQQVCGTQTTVYTYNANDQLTDEHLTDTSDSAKNRCMVYAFGNAVGFVPGEALTQFLYCGELFDHKLGWTYLRARYYDPKVGRFNRLDPFFGNLSDPQSLHKYTYCHNDPVNHVDPSGLFFVGLAFTGFSVLARFGKEAGYMAIATTALSSAFGAGTGAIGYYIAGENPWVGAYNGALIGAGVRIAYLTGGWSQVGKVFYDGVRSAVIRFVSDVVLGGIHSILA